MPEADVVIVGAARTAIGALNGGFAATPAHVLGAAAVGAALARAGVDPAEVDELILGQVLTAGQGQNPARQAGIAAGLPVSATAFGVNQVCGSGLRAVALGLQQIRSGDARIVVAGGQESMSLAPHCRHLRAGIKMGDASFVDTMLSDGLTDAFGGYAMGITAENVARAFGISRADQDAFAAASQQRAEAARAAGRFAAEIVPVTVPGRRESVVVDTDEFIRPGTTAEGLAKLKPAFEAEGTVTAGNSSGINDGAAAVVLMTAGEAARRGLQPLARIAAWATAGVEPAVMGTGPIPASRRALEKAGWRFGDLDLIEANEAFAAQACAVTRALELDPERVNVNGGAIALGHPIGASGARVLVTLLHEMARRDARKGLATLCIGGGMGIALCVER
jgi:acetyl-CoA C-acetyltransferase